jgi:hypothetical protein
VGGRVRNSIHQDIYFQLINKGMSHPKEFWTVRFFCEMLLDLYEVIYITSVDLY